MTAVRLGLRANAAQFSLLVGAERPGRRHGRPRAKRAAAGRRARLRPPLEDSHPRLRARVRRREGLHQPRRRQPGRAARSKARARDRLAGRRAGAGADRVGAQLGVHRRRQRPAWHQPGAGLVHDGDHEDRPGRPGSPRPRARPQRGGRLPRRRRRGIHDRRARRELRTAHRRLGRRGDHRRSPAPCCRRCSCATPARTSRWSSAATTATAPRTRLRTAFATASFRDPVLRACSQAGLVNNLNDALAWGLAPLFLAAHGASVQDIAIVAAVYPVMWGAGQLVTGWLSDHTGRKPLIASGMLVQAGALAILVAGNGAFPPSLLAAFLLGVGTAMVYPTLIAAVSDACQPRDRARVVGVYRFWRDFGFALGALIAGIGADLASPDSGDRARRGAHRCKRPGCCCYDVAVTSRCSCHRNTCDPKRRTPMAIEVEGLDVALLRSEIQRTYADVSTQPDREFIFPTGRAWALDLGYPQDLLARVPEASCESFAGVANPFSHGSAPARRGRARRRLRRRHGHAGRRPDGRPHRLGHRHRHDAGDGRQGARLGRRDGARTTSPSSRAAPSISRSTMPASTWSSPTA